MKVKGLNGLPDTFWGFLSRLSSYADSLIDVLDRERLALIAMNVMEINSLSKAKDSLANKVLEAERQLAATIDGVLQRADINKKTGERFKDFYSLLSFNDYLKFSKWLNSYRKKRKELLLLNIKNMEWANRGRSFANDLAAIMLGAGHNTCVTYDSKGRLRGARHWA